MKILLFLIALLVLISCTKEKTPPKDECIEPYVGDYKVIEMRKADGTIIPEDKIRDSLQADHAWIERRAIYQQSAPYDQERWIYMFHWANYSNRIIFCNSNQLIIPTRKTNSFDSLHFQLFVEFLPDTFIVNKVSDTFIVNNIKNSAYLKMIKQ